MSPRDYVAALERERRTHPAPGDRFTGYGLTGLAFGSGDVVGFCRVTASSVGPPFSMIWHRTEEGRWTVHSSIHPSRACPLDLGGTAGEVRIDDIDLQWNAPDEVVVSARRARLQLVLRLEGNRGGNLLVRLAALLPARMLAGGAGARAMGGLPVGVRRIGADTAPPSRPLSLRPTRVWKVAGAACVENGRDLGSVVRLDGGVSLGDLVLPAAGLVSSGSVVVHTAAGGAPVDRGPEPGADRGALRDTLIADLIRSARITAPPGGEEQVP